MNEHLDVDEAVPDVHRPGHVDGGRHAALVQPEVVDSAVGRTQLPHLLSWQISCIIRYPSLDIIHYYISFIRYPSLLDILH